MIVGPIYSEIRAPNDCGKVQIFHSAMRLVHFILKRGTVLELNLLNILQWVSAGESMMPFACNIAILKCFFFVLLRLFVGALADWLQARLAYTEK